MLGRLVNERMRTAGLDHPWGTVLPALKSCDLVIANLETAFTLHQTAAQKRFTFKADASHVDTLTRAGIKIVNLANNHSLDFGVLGLLDTLQTLNSAGIAHVGAGRNYYQAAQPAILTSHGIRIGVIGATDNEPDWQAGPQKPGTAYVSLTATEEAAALRNRLLQRVTGLAQRVDLVIVSLHWGPNWQERPPQEFVQFAHDLIDAGATIIHGHSNHMFQGIEQYKMGLILYQTGDFIDDYAIDPVKRNDLSFLFIVTVKQQATTTVVTRVEAIPTRIEDMRVDRAVGHEAQAAVARLKLLSQQLCTARHPRALLKQHLDRPRQNYERFTLCA